VQVEVRVFATLRRYVPQLGVGEALDVEVDPGTTFAQLGEQLDLPSEEVKIVMRNNRQVGPNDEIADGDRIAYIPAVAGG
jgi:molybdopterin synthase sulfur carrier subunit